MSPISAVKVLYEKWAKQYDKESKWNPAVKLEENLIIPLLNPRKKDLILEIGCGTGRLTIPISRKCKKIIGIDFSERMLEVARIKSLEYRNMEFRKLDARRKLPFDDAYFDKVICPLAINHIGNIREFFKEIYRVLKSGGIFVFDDANPDAEYAKLRHADLLAKTALKDKRLFSMHSIDEHVHGLHRSNFEIEEIRFTRYDKRIKHMFTKDAFERNKGTPSVSLSRQESHDNFLVSTERRPTFHSFMVWLR